MDSETCTGSAHEDEYAAEKGAYVRGKADYTLESDKTNKVVKVFSPFPKKSMPDVMWHMGYNYMHALEVT